MITNKLNNELFSRIWHHVSEFNYVITVHIYVNTVYQMQKIVNCAITYKILNYYIIIGFFKFTNAPQIVTTSSIIGSNVMGISWDKILNPFLFRIFCSINNRNWATSFVCLISHGHIWYAPLFPGGTISRIFCARHSCSILNPLSAITAEYISIESRKLECLTMALSLMLPGYESEINVIAELGEQPTKTLMVLWCLYSDQVIFWRSGLLGVSMKHSKQSIICDTSLTGSNLWDE